jgi:hypothetical protein
LAGGTISITIVFPGWTDFQQPTPVAKRFSQIIKPAVFGNTHNVRNVVTVTPVEHLVAAKSAIFAEITE